MLFRSREAVDVLRAKGYSGRAWVIPQFGVDPALFTPSPSRDPARPFTGYGPTRLKLDQSVALLAPNDKVRLRTTPVAVAMESQWTRRHPSSPGGGAAASTKRASGCLEPHELRLSTPSE